MLPLYLAMYLLPLSPPQSPLHLPTVVPRRASPLARPLRQDEHSPLLPLSPPPPLRGLSPHSLSSSRSEFPSPFSSSLSSFSSNSSSDSPSSLPIPPAISLAPTSSVACSPTSGPSTSSFSPTTYGLVSLLPQVFVSPRFGRVLLVLQLSLLLLFIFTRWTQ